MSTTPITPTAPSQESLDWLKWVSGINDDEIARWDPQAWAQWEQAMLARRDQECPSVPAWMRPLMEQWSWDFSAPHPTVAHLWPTSVDWFAHARDHQDLQLRIYGVEGEDFPTAEDLPTVEGCQRAWELARQAGADPYLSMSVLPTKPYGKAVIGELEGFAVVTAKGAATELLGDITHALGYPNGRCGIGPFGALEINEQEQQLTTWLWVC